MEYLHEEHDPKTRILNIPSGSNIRELGGIPLEDNDGFIAKRRIIRGEAPALLSEEGVDALLEYGVRHVIDLRNEREIEVEGHGHLQKHIDEGRVKLHHVDLNPPKGWAIIPEIGYHPYQNLANTYFDALDNGGEKLVEALIEAFTFDEHGPHSALYVHCAVGKDRTGVVTATILAALGADYEAIVDDYVLTGESYLPLLEKLSSLPPYEEDMTDVKRNELMPRRSIMEEVLVKLDEHGGAESFLKAKGLPENMLVEWQETLVYREEDDTISEEEES